jgi:hypothetical protein
LAEIEPAAIRFHHVAGDGEAEAAAGFTLVEPKSALA